MLNCLPLRESKGVENAHQSFRTEETHQIILQGNEKSGFTRVSLTAGTSAELVIDTAGFMPLRSNNHQTAQLGNTFAQLDIRTTAGHVGSNGNGPGLSGLSDNLSFHLMKLGIQYFMRNSPLL